MVFNTKGIREEKAQDPNRERMANLISGIAFAFNCTLTTWQHNGETNVEKQTKCERKREKERKNGDNSDKKKE